MNFWIIAIILLAVPAAIISWPFFTGSTKDRIGGMLVLLLFPVVGLIMYQNVGTPEAIGMPAATPPPADQTQGSHASNQMQMNEMVARLQQRMNDNPDDPEGWLILGRTLKTMQRYTEAESALVNANRLSPDTPLIMIELAEAQLFASGQAKISSESQQLIESALAIDPQQQKGLWLLGMAAAQNGNQARAVSVWQSLLSLLDPASGAAETVKQQIEMARTHMAGATTGGAESPHAMAQESSTSKSAAGLSIPVTISVSEDLASAVPGTATLFVFIHPAGAAGMPLAVKRLAAQGFPMSLQFSDADLLRPGMSLKEFEKLDISARISMSGTANIASGDIQATTVTVDTKALTQIAIHLDQRVP